MQFLTIAMIIAVSVGTFLEVSGVLPHAVRYAPEVLSVLAAGYVVLAGPRDRFRFMPVRYWVAFTATALLIFCGVVAHGVGTGPLIGGLRYYLRAIPFFFLPVVYRFTEKDVERQTKLLLALALLQLPISVYQRWTLVLAHRWSGDPVVGTMVISSIMSIFLIGAICVVTGFMLKKRIGIPVFFILFLLFLLPTTINETKATLFLLPIGLITTLALGSAPGKRLRVAMSGVLLVAVFLAIFVPVYNRFSTVDNPYPFTITDYFGNPHWVAKSVDKDAGVGSRVEVGRIDAIVIPLREYVSRPIDLLIGAGIGNASRSSIGSQEAGAYYQVFGRYAEASSAGTLLLEIGLLGCGLVFWLYWMIFRDAMYVAAHDSTIKGSIALGWIGVTAVMAIATFYKQILVFESISYLFWYFSGLIAATRMQLANSDSRPQVRTSPSSRGRRSGRVPGPRSAKARIPARPGNFNHRV